MNTGLQDRRRGDPAARFLLLPVAAALMFLAGCGAITPTPTREEQMAASPWASASATLAEAEPTTATPPMGTTMAEASAPPPSTTMVPTTALPTARSTASGSPTPAPPSATASASPTALPPSATPAGPETPQVLDFRIRPTVTENVGDKLLISWQATGERAELCPMQHGPVTGRCQVVPLRGSIEFVTDEESLYYAGFGLKVTAGEEVAWATETVHLQCQNLRTWFFEDPPQRCPAEEAVESYAAAQYFERGLMLWIEEEDFFYVFYEGEDEYGRQSFDSAPAQNVKPGASENDRVGEAPPPGLYEPVSGFGLVWRGEVEGIDPKVRERLGWATEPEFGYTIATQCQLSVVRGAWTCYLRGPRGEVIRYGAMTTAGYPLIWDYYRTSGP
jgi:hypothetical protein